MEITSKQDIAREARFWNRIAKRYAQKPVPNQEVYEQKLEKTRAYLNLEDKVLEIGCGTGSTALLHAKDVAHILATDISEKMIEIASHKALEQGVDNVTFEVARVKEIRARATTFDVILAHSILHLLPDVEGTLRALAMMLKPGGYLIGTTACIADFMPIFRYIAPLGKALGIFPYVNIFSEQEFKAWLTAAGFKLEESWLPSPKSGLYTVARKTS